MMTEDSEPKDWEISEVTPPEKLEIKWLEESLSQKETVCCPACSKEVLKEALTCVYCGAQTFHDSGLLGKLLKWFKQLVR